MTGRVVLVLAVASGLVAAVAAPLTEPGTPAPMVAEERTDPNPASTVSSEERPEDAIVLALAGDAMAHLPQVQAAWRDGAYDFTPVFELVRPLVAVADLAIINLETTLADRGYSGYPRFRTPDSYAQALARTGFDVVGHANNHSLDGGPSGTAWTRDVAEAVGLRVVGTCPSGARSDSWTVLDVEGVRVGITAYTYGTNGIASPRDQPFLVNMLEPDVVRRDIERIRLAGAELIVVLVHWGDEYQPIPSAAQRRWAADLVTWGADIVAGSHPHVVQPVEWVEAGERRGLVAYSLGNFVSNQIGRGRDQGLVLTITVQRDLGSGMTVRDVGYETVWVRRTTTPGGGRTYQLIPVHQVLAGCVDPLPPLTPMESAVLASAAANDAMVEPVGAPRLACPVRGPAGDFD